MASGSEPASGAEPARDNQNVDHVDIDNDFGRAQ